MSQYVEGPVTIEVPATSANLGPGFDCLGLALEMRDTLTAEVDGDELVIDVEGEGADEVPLDGSHLVARAMDAAFGAMGVRTPGVRLHCVNRIPHSRGLGSSSAAIVGGIALARGLVADGERLLPTDLMLKLANAIEGHPDNVAPAIFGGLVVSGQDDESVWADQAPIQPSIGTVVFIPPHGVRTDVARGLLPESVSHHDAVANTGRAALLVAALAAAPQRLLRGTEDFLHQSYRQPAMPESLALVERLRGTEIPAVVSGAGPTVLAFVAPGTPAEDDVLRHAPEGWRALPLPIAPVGVRRVDGAA